MQEKLNRLTPWLANVHWPLLLAGIAEIPRWITAFSAIRETWFGMPLAIMITMALSKISEYVFRRIRMQARMHMMDRIIVLILLLLLGMALIAITPILYLLSEPEKTISMVNFNLATVDPFRLLWTFSLAILTFLPLIGLAAVRASEERVEPVPAYTPSVSAPPPAPAPAPAPIPLPAQALPLVDVPRLPAPKRVVSETADEREARRQQAWHLLFVEGRSKAEVAATLQVTERTVSNYAKAYQG